MTYDEITTGLSNIKEYLLHDHCSGERLMLFELKDEYQNYVHCINDAIFVIKSIQIPKYLLFKNLIDHGYDFYCAGEKLGLCNATITRFRNNYLRSLSECDKLILDNQFKEE